MKHYRSLLLLPFVLTGCATTDMQGALGSLNGLGQSIGASLSQAATPASAVKRAVTDTKTKKCGEGRCSRTDPSVASGACQARTAVAPAVRVLRPPFLTSTAPIRHHEWRYA